MANTATGAAEAGEKEFFTTLLDMLHEGAAIIDEQGDILAENAQWSQYFSAPTAMPPHEKQNFVSLLSSDRLVLNLQDKERLRENFSQVAAGVLPECAGTYEHSGRGSWWWLRAHLKQFNHRSRRLVLVRLEKLELVTRENGAEGPAAFYRALLEDLPVWLYICDRDERFVWANLEFRRRFGLALTEIVGRKIEEIIPPEAQSRLRELRHRCYETGTEQSETLRFQVNDQESVMHFHYLPVLDSDGSVAYLVSACRDITHQTKVEESRTMTQRLLNEIIERMPIAFLAVDHEFHILRANQAACELFGYTREELVGMHVHKLVPAQFHERHSALMHDFAASASVGLAMHERGDVLGLKRDGSEFPMLASVLKMALGDFPLYCVMIWDLTRIREAEKRLLKAETHLLQMQKQEALGQLAGNIAHDFNNLMAIVLGYADMIQEKSDLPREIGIMMSEIKKAVQRGATLTKQILAYAKHQQLQVKPMSLHALVESHVVMLQSLLTASVRLELALEAQRDMVALDEGQFMQVLLNLAVNARDAMPMGGASALPLRSSRWTRHFSTTGISCRKQEISCCSL
jgi:PAS domain S-box-containing protein